MSESNDDSQSDALELRLDQRSFDVGPLTFVGRLGVGGMGEVWRARHDRTERALAVKVVASEHAGDEAYHRRFEREARVASTLHHPGIVSVYDIGTLPDSTPGPLPSGGPHLTMELADAGSVRGLSPPLPWPRVSRIVREVLDALAHAHARRVVHRDLAPTNLLFASPSAASRRGLKITDFGLALHDPPSRADVGAPSDTVCGTPRYMAPEQLAGRWRDLGPETDLYALGCILRELVAGSPPFDGETADDVARRHLEAPIPALDAEVDVPAGLEQWYARLLQKHPLERFRSAAEAVQGLEEFDDADPVESGTGAVRSGRSPPLAEEPLSSMSTLATLVDETTLLSDVDEAARAPAVGPEGRESDPHDPQPRVAPTVPDNWGTVTARESVLPPAGVGLGLFRHRRTPMVDRLPERDRIWTSVRRSLLSGRSTAICLQGDRGVGKTRLAQWVGIRTEELGLGTWLQINLEPDERAALAVGRSLARRLRCEEMERDQLRTYVSQRFARHGVTAKWKARTVGDFLFDCTPGRGDDSHVPDPGPELPDSLAEFIETLSPRGATVVVFDDLEWGTGAVELLSALLRRPEGNGPIVVLATLPAGDSTGADRRPFDEALPASNRAHDVKLGPLPPASHGVYVREILGLEPPLADRVAKRTEGNPAFARQLVESWADRDLLVPGERGFGLETTVEPTVPSSLGEQWRRRAEELLEPLDDSARRGAELAAVLGGRFTRRDWRAVRDRTNTDIDPEVPNRLVEADLLEATRDGWRFRREPIREELCARSRRAGRWRSFNRAAADACAGDDDAPAPRVARHLERAGELRRAAEVLFELVGTRGRAHHLEAAGRYLADLRRLASRLDWSADERRRSLLTYFTARHAMTGEVSPDRAREQFETVAERADAEGWDVLKVRSRAALAKLAHLDGRYPEAVAILLRLRESLAPGELGALHRARIERQLGEVIARTGLLDEADAVLRTAHGRVEDSAGAERVKIAHERAQIDYLKRDFDAARRGFERCRELFESLGSRVGLARAHGSIGDACRMIERFDEAANHYGRALRIGSTTESVDCRHLQLSFDELALERGNPEGARGGFERFAERFSPDELPPSVAVQTAGFRCWTAAASGDWSTLSEVSTDCHLPGDDQFHPRTWEISRSFRRAGRRARDADRPALARRCDHLAARTDPFGPHPDPSVLERLEQT
ncbi:MAG: protein kinase [Bradymonadaceae bacterium]